eukprot:scaffold529_cov308-Pinguiococcus_pyrenoidosus.AAC.54
MSLIAEGTGEEDADGNDEDEILRFDTVERYAELLFDSKAYYMPTLLVQLIAWVLGEYGTMLESYDAETLMNRVSDIAQNPEVQSASKGYLITALMKLTAATGACPGSVTEVVELYSGAKDADLQNRCLEFLGLLKAPEVMVAVLPLDASCEEIELDESLSFLNAFVQSSLAAGASVYNPPDDDDVEDDAGVSGAAQPAFNFTPYAKPEVYRPQVDLNLEELQGGANGMSGGAGRGHGTRQDSKSAGVNGSGALNLHGVARRWGKPPPATVATAAAQYSPDAVAAPVSRAAPDSKSHGTPPLVRPASKGDGGPETKEPTERELMAAALFGGLKPAATSSTKPRVPQKARRKAAARAEAPRVEAAQAKETAKEDTRAKAPTPPPAVEPNLLDFDAPVEPEAAPASSFAGAFDMLADLTLQPTPAEAPPALAAPADLDMLTVQDAPGDAAPAPAAGADLDVFSAMADLVVPNAPTILSAPSKVFQYNGQMMTALSLSVAEYGARWGRLRGTAKDTIRASVRSVDELAAAFQQYLGAQVIEKVANTHEVIAAGTVASHAVLIHGMAQPSKGMVVISAKAAEASVSAALVEHLKRSI